LTVGLLEISDTIADQDLNALDEGLAAHTIDENAPELIITRLAILQRDKTGRVQAGLCGKSFWNWTNIESLWVDKSLRGQGRGRALLVAAEAEAARRGCIGVYLWTQSFDAPGFYQKMGYTQFAAMDDFPVGHQRIGYRKMIVGVKR